MTPAAGRLPEFVDDIVRQLRRHGLRLGVDDCQALHTALGAGFGWRSDREFLQLCVALWAKSPREAAVISAVLARAEIISWEPPDETPGDDLAAAPRRGEPDLFAADGGVPPDAAAELHPPSVEPSRPLSTLPPSSGVPSPSLVLTPQFPVTEREAAQIWRGLRRTRRQGPAVRLDVAGTVDLRCRLGVATPPVLAPASVNTARLALLIDASASMTPYRDYAEHVVEAIRSAARFAHLSVVYFRNVLGYSDHRYLLDHDGPPGRTSLDAALPSIPALVDGDVYADWAMTTPVPFAELLGGLGADSGVAVISDAGAARGALSQIRLLDTVAGLKSLTARAAAVAWLNPAPQGGWRRTTAGRLARHIPMYPLTVEGMYRAVDVLRGRQSIVERPL